MASADTSGVLPLITTLEKETLPLREDLAIGRRPNDRDLVLGLAVKTEEEYFVAPLPAHHLLPPPANECEFLSCP